jgi:hypothetical protein
MCFIGIVTHAEFEPLDADTGGTTPTMFVHLLCIANFPPAKIHHSISTLRVLQMCCKQMHYSTLSMNNMSLCISVMCSRMRCYETYDTIM